MAAPRPRGRPGGGPRRGDQRADLHPARLPAVGERACRGAGAGASGRRADEAPGPWSADPQRRPAGCPSAPAHARGDDRVELRAARRRAAGAVPPPVGVRRRLYARRRRAGVRRRSGHRADAGGAQPPAYRRGALPDAADAARVRERQAGAVRRSRASRPRPRRVGTGARLGADRRSARRPTYVGHRAGCGRARQLPGGAGLGRCARRVHDGGGPSVAAHAQLVDA